MSIKECRICYENDEEGCKTFITPCACSGTGKYVHPECLEIWRERKRGTIDFIRCNECLYFYNIAKVHQVENAILKIDLPLKTHQMLGTFWLTMFTFVISSAMYIMDSQLIIVRNTIIHPKSLIRFLKYNHELGFLYYFAFLNCLLCTIAYLGIFGYIGYKVKNHRRYLKKSWIFIVSFFLGNFHFFIFRAFMFVSHFIETYLYLTGMFSLLQIVELQTFCHFHNKIIKTLNKTNKYYIKNYDPSHNTQDINNNIMGEMEIDILNTDDEFDDTDSDESSYLVHPEDSLPILYTH